MNAKHIQTANTRRTICVGGPVQSTKDLSVLEKKLAKKEPDRVLPGQARKVGDNLLSH